MRRHRLISALTAAALSLALVGQGAAGVSAQHPARPGLKGTIVIGQITSKGGIYNDFGEEQRDGFQIGLMYATNGTMKVDAARLVVKQYNDVSSTNSLPDTSIATQEATTAIESDHAQILQCCVSSATATAVAAVAGKYKKILMVAPAADNPLSGINRYTFRTSRENAQDAIVGAPYAARHLGKTYMMIMPDYAFGHDQAAAWGAQLDKYGAKNLGTIYFPLTTTDFTPFIQQIVAKKPSFFINECVGCFPLYKQLDQQGVLDKIPLVAALPNIAAWPLFGSSISKIVFVGIYYYKWPHNKANDYLIKETQKIYHRVPDVFDQDAFAAAQSVVAALKKTHSTSSGPLIKALEGLSVQGPKGAYTIRKQDHVSLQPMYIAKVSADLKPTLLHTYTAKQTAPPMQTHNW